MDVDPHRGMLLAEILGQLGVGHQVKEHQLHGAGSSAAASSSLTSARHRVNRVELLAFASVTLRRYRRRGACADGTCSRLPRPAPWRSLRRGCSPALLRYSTAFVEG